MYVRPRVLLGADKLLVFKQRFICRVCGAVQCDHRRTFVQGGQQRAFVWMLVATRQRTPPPCRLENDRSAVPGCSGGIYGTARAVCGVRIAALTRLHGSGGGGGGGRSIVQRLQSAPQSPRVQGRVAIMLSDAVRACQEGRCAILEATRSLHRHRSKSAGFLRAR